MNAEMIEAQLLLLSPIIVSAMMARQAEFRHMKVTLRNENELKQARYCVTGVNAVTGM